MGGICNIHGANEECIQNFGWETLMEDTWET
jgi:hypothetical protein